VRVDARSYPDLCRGYSAARHIRPDPAANSNADRDTDHSFGDPDAHLCARDASIAADAVAHPTAPDCDTYRNPDAHRDSDTNPHANHVRNTSRRRSRVPRRLSDHDQRATR
jgi:hypothetical protein